MEQQGAYLAQQDPSNIARGLATQLNSPPYLADPGPVLPRFLERFFPELLVPTQPLNQVGYTWSVYYNFDQYLWSPAGASHRGIGVFFQFGASDGVANAIKYAYNLGLGHEDAIEMYYNAVFAPWLSATLDLQIIDQAAREEARCVWFAAQGHEHRRRARAARLRTLLI